MLDSFPTCLFSFAQREIMVVQNKISGGTALNGDETIIATDGGGRWQADYQNAPLNKREKVMAWRAFRAICDDGPRPFVFPICDARHQPTAGKARVTHSDGTPFGDDTPYESGDCTVYAAASAPVRATSLELNIVSLGKPLVGGERFSIDHPTWRHRLYEVKKIEGNSIQFRPPLREAVSVGTSIDFADPKCVMRLIGDMSAPVQGPRFASGSINLVEDMTGSYA